VACKSVACNHDTAQRDSCWVRSSLGLLCQIREATSATNGCLVPQHQPQCQLTCFSPKQRNFTERETAFTVLHGLLRSELNTQNGNAAQCGHYRMVLNSSKGEEQIILRPHASLGRCSGNCACPLKKLRCEGYLTQTLVWPPFLRRLRTDSAAGWTLHRY
jgi:hypothetical protein